MNCGRLECLAALLDRVGETGPSRFDLAGWGANEIRQAGFLWLRRQSCNTAACAVGLACVSGIFADDGLSYSEDADGKITPSFAGLEGWSAVKTFFDVDQNQAVELFAEHSYAITTGPEAARMVAARIRLTIARCDGLAGV
jgi:hypothetical protein